MRKLKKSITQVKSIENQKKKNKKEKNFTADNYRPTWISLPSGR